MLQKEKKKFPFVKNDVVLARYGSDLFYAKILSINYKRKFAKLLFDDDSKEEISFRKIYSVDEETSDIICIICKNGKADSDNDIVLCDSCDVGYHQMCHEPFINSKVLLPEVPWECIYCADSKRNPYISENPFEESDDQSDSEEFSTGSQESKTITKDDDVEEMETFENNCNDNVKINNDEKAGLVTIEKNEEINNEQSAQSISMDDESPIVVTNADNTSTHVDVITDIAAKNDRPAPQHGNVTKLQPKKKYILPPTTQIPLSPRDSLPDSETKVYHQGYNLVSAHSTSKELVDVQRDIDPKDTTNSVNYKEEQQVTEMKQNLPRRTSFVDPVLFNALSLQNSHDMKSSDSNGLIYSDSKLYATNFLNDNRKNDFSAATESEAFHDMQSNVSLKAFIPQVLPLSKRNVENIQNTSIGLYSQQELCPTTLTTLSIRKSPNFQEKPFNEYGQSEPENYKRSAIRCHSSDQIRDRSFKNVSRRLSSYHNGVLHQDRKTSDAKTNLTFSAGQICSRECFNGIPDGDLFILEKSRYNHNSAEFANVLEKEHCCQDNKRSNYDHIHRISKTNKPNSPFEKSYLETSEIEILATQIKELEDCIQRQDEEIEARKALLHLHGFYRDDSNLMKSVDHRMYKHLCEEELRYYHTSHNLNVMEKDKYNESVFMSSEHQLRRTRLHSDLRLLLQDAYHYGKSRAHDAVKRPYSDPFNSPPPPAKRTRTAIMIPHLHATDRNNNNNLFEVSSSPNHSDRFSHNGNKFIRRSHSVELHSDVYMKKGPATMHRCNICKRSAQFLCGACRKTWYCTQKCQLSDWNQHLAVCDEH